MTIKIWTIQQQGQLARKAEYVGKKKPDTSNKFNIN